MMIPQKKQLEELELEETRTIIFSKKHNNNEIRHHQISIPSDSRAQKGLKTHQNPFSQTPKRHPFVHFAVVFSVLGAHMSYCQFQYWDIFRKKTCGMMANSIEDSGGNKGQLSNLVEALCRDFLIIHDKH